MNERLLYLSEADDDLQEVSGWDTNSLLRRIYCYYLLSDSLILHPAYVWQSKTTNNLVFGPLSQLLVPPNVRMLLGDSVTVKEYITDRIDRLDPLKLNLTTNEYLQYKRWGREIKEGAVQLDRVFSRGEVTSLRESRDKKFRRLLVDDISLKCDPNSLYTQIAQFIQIQGLHIEMENVVQSLKEFIESSFLVSMETFINYIAVRIGLQRLVLLANFRKKILKLYYRANINEDMYASGFEVLGDKVIDPFDSDVFWAVVYKLFGKKAAKILSAGTETALMRALAEIRDSEVWLHYRSIYFNILEQIEQSLWRNVNLIVQKIKREPSYSDAFVLRHIWNKEKLVLIGTIFGIVSTSATLGSPSLLPFGIIAASANIYQLQKDIRRFVCDYRSNDFTKVKHLINEEVEKILLLNKESGVGKFYSGNLSN